MSDSVTTPHEHIIKSYDAELSRLLGEITRMGELAGEQLAMAAEAVEERNSDLARKGK